MIGPNAPATFSVPFFWTENNAIAIIELQLQLLSRQAGGNTRIEKCAHEIQQCLSRITSTVEALKRVRRIVLTDYTAGVKMLDLQRSVES